MLNLNVHRDAFVMSMTKVPNVYRRTRMQNLFIYRTACPGTSKKLSSPIISSKSFQPMPFQNVIISRKDYWTKMSFYKKVSGWIFFIEIFLNTFVLKENFLNRLFWALIFWERSRTAVKIRAVAISKFWNLDFLKRSPLHWNPQLDK